MRTMAQSGDFPEYGVAELYAATGGFHKLCLIGEGGFGKVYRAMINYTPVAIKVLDPQGLQGIAEYKNEIQLARSIHHPHIVRLLGFTGAVEAAAGGGGGGSDGGTQCLVYELLTNGNLEDRLLRRTAPTPALLWPVRVRIAAQISDALAYLHSLGIIHRDIKPANMFLDANMDAKLGDIGLAALDGWRAGASRARDDSAVGTWAYLAPEYKTAGVISPATDTWAMGLCLLQLVLGKDPRDIVRQVQDVLDKCTLPEVVDSTAGSWDMKVAERLVKLGLWCCMHDARQRPAVSAVAQELVRMVVALQKQGLLEPTAT
ncbi:hypothetical protein VOLCADRAFT_79970 [Volvox carteri f. nagariensis]|uniref:Protein kinase domain-containing protein n=1 Tax=Volvox carteri f. nagariensis TaxID=3068 RepID=D8TNW4_VOLCA|nr:uncharacterized protein VOLCADRAFT_79970 [Volvox carteri f. nagariensis]EFJ51062.1 hypothetical protein VOLCADRAFT_79970 [Volvox carteri f. nagariensis]|eukprot:XP_002948074.1 hypothetical protein VOLCADRAFT_79970 [Volvox carteri f. nagariensis]